MGPIPENLEELSEAELEALFNALTIVFNGSGTVSSALGTAGLTTAPTTPEMPGFEPGDFSEVGGPCDAFSCEFDLDNFELILDDALLTPFGDTFDVSVILFTSALNLGGIAAPMQTSSKPHRST